jgi:hypothetical protein
VTIEDKNFLLGIEKLFKNKIEKYDEVLNQITPQFRCTVDNYNIKFHKPNDVIGEPENMGDSDHLIILPFNVRLDFMNQEKKLMTRHVSLIIKYCAQVPSNLKTRLENITNLENGVKILE